MISGQSAEETSRFIQVLDDYQLTADDATTATKALTKQGLAPNIETLAKLSDQYLAINKVEDRNAFVLKNLGKAGLEWNNVLKQGSAALRESAAGINEALILSQKQVDEAEKLRLSQDKLNDTIDAYKIKIGNELVPVLNDVLVSEMNWQEAQAESKLHTELSGIAMGNLALKIYDEKQAAYEAESATKDFSQALDDSAQSAADVAARQKEIQDAYNETSKTYSTLIGVIGNLQTIHDDFQEKWLKLTDERMKIEQDWKNDRAENASWTEKELYTYLGKLQEVIDKEKLLSVERDRQMKEFMAGIMLQQLSIDGLTDAEFAAYTKYMENSGLWSKQVVEDALTAWNSMREFVDNVNNANPTIVVNFKQLGFDEIAANLAALYGRSEITPIPPPVFHAHAEGGSFLIPTSYGNEGFRMGNGDTASGGERVTITPKGGNIRQAPLDLSSSTIDTLARRIVSAFAQAG